MGERQVLTAEKMAAGGDAIAHLVDGRVVFVAGALPGEQVLADVHTMKKDFARATVVEVVESVDGRVSPPCPELARGCGGCAWQHASPELQMTMKADVVRDALRRTAKLPDAVVREGGAVTPWRYRTTMRVAVAPDGRVGLRAAASRSVVPLENCPVAHPSLAAMLAPLRVRGADEVTLRVSAATGEVTALPDRAGARIDGLPADAGVGPDAVLHEEVAGVRLRVSAASFFQSGPQAAELLVAAVRDACGDLLGQGALLDAYGGVGLFAATLTDGRVEVVESSASACADARVNLGDRATVTCTTFERWAPREVPLVVADPARAGLGRVGVGVLAATGAERVVLVSCDPVAMARDTALLAEAGYVHAGATVLDLFPHTPHVEVVTRFDRVEFTS